MLASRSEMTETRCAAGPRGAGTWQGSACSRGLWPRKRRAGPRLTSVLSTGTQLPPSRALLMRRNGSLLPKVSWRRRRGGEGPGLMRGQGEDSQVQACSRQL